MAQTNDDRAAGPQAQATGAAASNQDQSASDDPFADPAEEQATTGAQSQTSAQAQKQRASQKDAQTKTVPPSRSDSQPTTGAQAKKDDPSKTDHPFAQIDDQPQNDARRNSAAQPPTVAPPKTDAYPAQSEPWSQADIAAQEQAEQLRLRAQSDEQPQPGFQPEPAPADQAQTNPAERSQLQEQAVAQPQPGNPGQTDVGIQANVNQFETSDFGLEFDPATARGLTIAAMERDSVFFNSGLQPRDVLVSVGGRPVRTFVDFQRFIAIYPGVRIPVIVLRDGREHTVYITSPGNLPAARQPQPLTQAPLTPDVGAQSADRVAKAFLGVKLDPLFENAAVVLSLNPGGPAEAAGLRPGDMIEAINNVPVISQHDVLRVLSQMQPGQRVDVAFSRRVRTRTAAVLAGSPSPRRYDVGNTPERVLRQVIPQAVVPQPAYVAPTPTYVAPPVTATYVAPTVPTYVSPTVVAPSYGYGPWIAGRPIYNGVIRPAVPVGVRPVRPIVVR